MANEKKLAEKIATAVASAGGRTFYVGGYVRDKMLGIETKDFDIEVHGVSVDVLEEILDNTGKRLEFGKSFGVYNIKGSSVDIAMPRKEECIGNRHTDFKVDIDPFCGTEKAAERRDFTMNAIMEDVLTGEIIDHFGGRRDIEKRVIRHVNDASFAEDPLRVLRAAQFASRFEFEIAKETETLCSSMDISTVSSERVFEELKKALLKAEKPSLFFEKLLQMEKLSVWFPEVEVLLGVRQNPKYHSEGNVYIHTMMVLDEAAKRRENVENKLGFMLAALTHDFGKAVTTEVIDGAIHSYRHEKEGNPIIESFLLRLTRDKKLIKYVTNLAEHHMRPNALAIFKSSVKATNKMFDDSCEPIALIHLAQADSLGCVPEERTPLSEQFLLERLAEYNRCMAKPYVKGEDLIAAGLISGRDFSEILAYTHKLRLSGVSKEVALKQAIAYSKEIRKQRG